MSASPIAGSAAAPQPQLPLSPLANFRDLAGIPVSGGVVRPGAAWRADDLSLIDPDSADTLLDQGLQAVIDLRTGAEVGLSGRGVLAHRPVSYHHLPLMASIAAAGGKGPDIFDQSGFTPMYIRLFEDSAAVIVTALAVIAHTPGAVAFHCAAGQDRTGVLATALLLSLGATTEEIVADYTRTGENTTAIHARIAPLIGPLMDLNGIDLDVAARAAISTQFSPRPMLGLMAHLHGTYGDPLEPLRRAGLSDPLIAQLRSKAVH